MRQEAVARPSLHGNAVLLDSEAAHGGSLLITTRLYIKARS